MKMLTMKFLVIPFALLAVLGSFAHAHGFSNSLGATRGATDLMEVTCSTLGGSATDHLYVRVRDDAPTPRPNPLVSVQVQKGRAAGNATDRGADGNSAFSAAIEVHGGDGVYHVQVDKSGPGAELYSIEYHCQSADGAHTQTSAVPFVTQNQ